MTTGGYPPPPQDPRAPGGYPGGSPSYGETPPDYTRQFPQYGSPEYGAPQHGTPQYGAQGNQYGAPQYGSPQYGSPQHGAPQYGGPQYGSSQYGAPIGGAPGYPGPESNFGGGAPGELLPRLGARIIDTLIVGIPMVILTFVMLLASGGSGFVSFFMTVVTGVVAFGYWTYLESTQGATFGKKLLGLSVVAPGGGHPTLEQAAKRNAFIALQILTGIPVLGFLASLLSLAAWIGIAVTIEQDGGKQGFHDKFAGGTQVRKS
ncbi:RDD family protein [Rhodococcus sp. CH91]|uniref:RDD family protein n=1 Tax=Rhodococcus sp. CH91 TaxID=2910256 RepID=UPI0027E00AB7|nr:RDD family protein [Rhodococcus sp. CH91]